MQRLGMLVWADWYGQMSDDVRIRHSVELESCY